MIEYVVEIIGGPFDGSAVPRWNGDHESPPPKVILVGTCPKGRDCGAAMCSRGLAAHTSYWAPGEKDVPVGAVAYEQQDEFVARIVGLLTGTAIYAIGGLLDPRNFGERAKEPAAGALSPLTYAGAVKAPAAPLHPDFDDTERWDPGRS